MSTVRGAPLLPDLRRYSLIYWERKDRWILEDDHNAREVKTFPTKGHALSGDALQRAVGPRGGIVKILRRTGHLQERRICLPTRDARKPRAR
jgi:hypothetical protein